MAARAAQEAEILTPDAARAFVAAHGIVCEAARHDVIPNLVDAIAGAPVRGSWWSHPRSKVIFALTRAVRAAPNVLVCRLVAGKITYVHERLWPALAAAAQGTSDERLDRLHESHTAGGRHVVESFAFPDWLPRELRRGVGAVDAASVERLRVLLR